MRETGEDRKEETDALPSLPSSQSRIIIVHQGALGDFILAIPVFEGLHRLDPNIRMDFWSKSKHVSLIANKFYVGEVRSCDRGELVPFFHEELWREASVPPFFQGTRAVFVFGQSSSKLLCDRLGTRTDAPVFWIQSFPNKDSTQSASEFLIEQMCALGWPMQRTFPNLECSPDERLQVRDWLAGKNWLDGEKPILVHPGSGSRKKIWPLTRLWAVLHWLCIVHKCRVILVLGPADGFLKGFAVETQSLGVELIEGISLGRLASFLCESRLYIGNDSGISHLAAAVGTPTVAIFGSTDARVWAPYGPSVQVVQSSWDEAETMVWSPTAPVSPPENKVLEIIESLISCSRPRFFPSYR